MRNFRASLIIAALFSGTAAYAETPGWTISESSGPVFVAKSGVTKVGLRGGALAAGDTVVTGAKGRAVLVRGTEYLIVASNSKLQIAPPTANSFTQIIQQVGNVVFKIKKQMTPHFAVETPYLAAVVKGTTFSVTVTPAGTSVQVTEGLVEVATLDRSVAHFVQPGEIGMISSANPRMLTVQGKETIRLEAPVLPGAPVAAKGETSPSQPAAAADPVSDGLVITAAVSEGPVSLNELSGGLVDGNSALVSANSSAETVQAIVQASTASEAVAPVLVEVAVVAPPVETAPAPVEVAVAGPVEGAPAPVEVAAALPAETAPAPVEVAVALPAETAPAPVEVAVALPAETAPAPVEVAAALPVETAPVLVEVAVALPIETAPAPVEVAVALPVETPTAPVEVAEVARVEAPVAAPVEVASVAADVAPVLPTPIEAGTEVSSGSDNGNSNNSGSNGNSSNNGNSNNSSNGNGSSNASSNNSGNGNGNGNGNSDSEDSFFARLLEFLSNVAEQNGVNLPTPGN